MTKTFGISESDAAKIPKLGYLCWYECSSTNQNYTAVRRLVEQYGFTHFPEANRKKAYHHALKSYRQEGVRITVDKISFTDADHFRHQITAMFETRNEINFITQVGTAFNRNTETVEVVADNKKVETQQFEDAIRQHIDDYMNRVHVDVIRDWVTGELVRMNAVSARKSGGLYFVPVANEDKVDSMMKLFEAIGSVFYAHPVFDTTTWRTNAAGFVEDDLIGEFKNMKGDLDQLVGEAKSSGEIKKYKLETLLGRFKKLESKEGLYEDLLQVKITDLQTGVKAVKKQIAALVLGKVNGIEAVDTAEAVRDRKRAALRKTKAVWGKKAARIKTKADKKKKASQASLAKKLALSKKAKKTAKKTDKKIVAAKKANTPF
jgi:hypothetical protein